MAGEHADSVVTRQPSDIALIFQALRSLCRLPAHSNAVIMIVAVRRHRTAAAFIQAGSIKQQCSLGPRRLPNQACDFKGQRGGRAAAVHFVALT